MKGDITSLLRSWKWGDEAAKNALFELVYATLRDMAQARLGAGGADATLRPTSLVHEAMLRMLGREIEFSDRAHFFAVAALKMRAVLVDYARARTAVKRGGGASPLTLSHAEHVRDRGGDTAEYEVLALHQALSELDLLDARAARVVELAFFGGMERGEIAVVLEVSVPTVDRELRFAKAWLNEQLA